MIPFIEYIYWPDRRTILKYVRNYESEEHYNRVNKTIPHGFNYQEFL